MTSLRQYEANRKNARLSSGPISDDGKSRSRRNALRHGLTAETVIHGLEDPDEYEAFQIAIASEFDAQTAVERELVLRLASLLWRLRRAGMIEAGLFQFHAGRSQTSRQQKGPKAPNYEHNEAQANAVPAENCREPHLNQPSVPLSTISPTDLVGSLTASFLRVDKRSYSPLDRLNRYEVRLWRQVAQTIHLLRCLHRRKLSGSTSLRWRNELSF
jgi:hypothetical protein